MITAKDWNRHFCISQEWWLQQMTVIVLLINYAKAQLQWFIGMMIPMKHCFHRTCLGQCICYFALFFNYRAEYQIKKRDRGPKFISFWIIPTTMLSDGIFFYCFKSLQKCADVNMREKAHFFSFKKITPFSIFVHSALMMEIALYFNE